ncbi:transposase [Pseudonocardia humida]|uniref:Transposase n=1 Tax=Pseudonocardia humida TaxID=2800819 RepID=A0ABT1A773_9PSEU|nr:transposase [Pseudonocardia humida]MCO1658867.1 transposase [Pseudonocardia humida]
MFVASACAAEGGFATEPELGVAMLNRAYQARALTSSSWVTVDEAYGQNPAFRDWLSAREIPFVLAARNDDPLTEARTTRTTYGPCEQVHLLGPAA